MDGNSAHIEEGGVPFCAVFSFTEDDRLKSETAYFDRYSILSQLGVISPS